MDGRVAARRKELIRRQIEVKVARDQPRSSEHSLRLPGRNYAREQI